MAKKICHVECENRWFLTFVQLDIFFRFCISLILLLIHKTDNNKGLRNFDKCNKRSQSDVFVLKKIKNTFEKE